MDNGKTCKENFEQIKEYFVDIYKALDYCTKNAGKTIEDMSVEESERDRLDMLSDEVDSLNRLINDVMGDYLLLAQDTDSAIEELESDTTIFTTEEKVERALKYLEGRA